MLCYYACLTAFSSGHGHVHTFAAGVSLLGAAAGFAYSVLHAGDGADIVVWIVLSAQLFLSPLYSLLRYHRCYDVGLSLDQPSVTATLLSRDIMFSFVCLHLLARLFEITFFPSLATIFGYLVLLLIIPTVLPSDHGAPCLLRQSRVGSFELHAASFLFIGCTCIAVALLRLFHSHLADEEVEAAASAAAASVRAEWRLAEWERSRTAKERKAANRASAQVPRPVSVCSARSLRSSVCSTRARGSLRLSVSSARGSTASSVCAVNPLTTSCGRAKAASRAGRGGGGGGGNDAESRTSQASLEELLDCSQLSAAPASSATSLVTPVPGTGTTAAPGPPGIGWQRRESSPARGSRASVSSQLGPAIDVEDAVSVVGCGVAQHTCLMARRASHGSVTLGHHDLESLSSGCAWLYEDCDNEDVNESGAASVINDLARQPVTVRGRMRSARPPSLVPSVTKVGRGGSLADGISYNEQLFLLWSLIDDEKAGYLNTYDLTCILEVCGVRAEAVTVHAFLSDCLKSSDDAPGFSDETERTEATATAALCSFFSFSATFEEYRIRNQFTSVFSRPHISAISQWCRDRSQLLSAQRVCSDVDSQGTGVLTVAQVSVALRMLQLPHEEEDATSLAEELGCTEEEPFVDVETLLSIYTCCHPRLCKEKIEPAIMLQARRAMGVKAKEYKTSEQARQDEIIGMRKASEKQIPLLWVYSVFTFTVVLARAAWDNRAESRSWVSVLFLFSDAIFIAWMYQRMRLPFEDSGQFVVNRRRILLAYLKSWAAVVDIIIVLPLEIIGMAVEGTLAPAPYYRMNKLLVGLYINAFLDRFAALVTHSPTVSRICKALFWLVVQAHVLSCLFKVVADDVGDESTALILSNFQNYSNRPFATQYLQAYDYSLKTMSGLSRGQPMPVDDLQHFNALLAALTGVAAYAFLLATIANALQVETQESRLLAQVDRVKSHLTYSGLPDDFRDTCVKYCHHVFASSGNYSSDNRLMEDLPMELDVRMRILTCTNVISKVPIFREVLDDGEFVYALSLKLQAEVVSPGQVVTQKGTPGSSMYFITHGEFVLVDDKGEAVLTLRSGNFFGEIALLHSVRRTATIKADRFCNVLRLEKHDFEEVAELFPDALVYIREAAEERIHQLILASREEESARASNSTGTSQGSPTPKSSKTNDNETHKTEASMRQDLNDWVKKRQMDTEPGDSLPSEDSLHSVPSLTLVKPLPPT